MTSIRRQVLKIGVVDIGVERAELPNGMSIELPVIRHAGASAIVALHDDGTIPLLSQYRHAIGGWLREIPAGCRNGSETALQCAQRELREETGLTARRWHKLGNIVTIPSFCDERIELFLARDLSFAEREPDPDEIINVEWIGFEQALQMIINGEIIDAKTIAGLYHANAFLRSTRAPQPLENL